MDGDPNTKQIRETNRNPRTARSPGPSYADLLATETRPVPEPLLDHAQVDLGTEDLPTSRYLDPARHDLEMERMWKRVWQVACREEDIPEPGDHEVYEIGELSAIVMRQADGSIKAFVNACLHRGRRLRGEGGSLNEIRCPFHGYTWNCDGSLKQIPCQWDFPQVDPASFSLPEIHVGRWAGFVFVNFADDPPSLEEYLGDLPCHVAPWALENRVKVVHVEKVCPANWKVALEAFIESYHVLVTHPEAIEYIGDANANYDVWPDQPHYSRMITPRGIASPHVMEDVTDDRILAAAYTGDPAEYGVDPAGKTPRQIMAELKRIQYQKQTGVNIDHATDSEAIDTIQYFLFPNTVFWVGYGAPIVYRYRPNGDDPETSIMECSFILPWPEGKPKPPPVRPVRLSLEQSWQEAEKLGALGYVFDQDVSNMADVQRGLKALRKGITLANYQESRIRHFAATLEAYLARA